MAKFSPCCFPHPHRLSVRNLPTQVDEKQLKSLFLKAAGGAPALIKQVLCHNIQLVHFAPFT